MNLGVQYYRAPFPEQRFWEADLKKIRESGLNTIQLWVLWGWVEADPDHFNFDDYDRLIELAGTYGLGVILSTIAEIQPHWIHRAVPGSEMIDHRGNKVISTLRCECNFGLTPGGCTDHPGVWERMKRFLQETGRHYADCGELRGWDIWNELRWNVQADGLVCFCDHTLSAYREWLRQQYGSLEALNAAWKRRYVCWEDVCPGKLPDRPYTELMSWQKFITARADRHGTMRHAAMREVDSHHVITAHGAAPSPLYAGDRDLYPIDRGNDWNLAASLDGIGCSSFPQWQGIDDADFGMRIEMVKSAAGETRQVWLSELQGGRAAIGFEIYGKVHAAQQQRWVWNGIACGADSILFWCWRDEVFGRESSGFGLAGRDGLAPERLEAMSFTGKLLEAHPELFRNYRPIQPEIGLLFSPHSYYLAWAQEASGTRIADALTGYARALVRNSLPCQFLEEDHLENLERFKLIILPRTIVTDRKMEQILLDYVEKGGMLLCESECGAFSREGFYRYPEERFPARAGIVEAGRRSLETRTIELRCGGFLHLEAEQWLTPLEYGDATGARPEVFATSHGAPLVAEYSYGAGRILYCGTYFGNVYRTTQSPDFEKFLAAIASSATVTPMVEVLSPRPTDDGFIYLKRGRSEYGELLFVFFPENVQKCELRMAPELFPEGRARDFLTGRIFEFNEDGGSFTGTISAGKFNMALLTRIC